MLRLQNDILEMVARGEPLAATARALCLKVEAACPGVVCSIIGVDDEGRLRPVAGPSLPAEYCAAIDGQLIGPEVGSCGTAIFTGRPVEAVDIAVDPRWTGIADMPLAMGLKACWSTPITGRDGEVLGAFAFYFRETRTHTATEAQAVRASTHLCAIAMERDRHAEAQHRLAYRDMLTGLPNRAAFNAAAGRMAAEGRPFGGLLLVDLDNLKVLNDTFGHRAGDELIQAAARRIERGAAPHRAFRLGGDEFAVLADGEPRPDIQALADSVLAALAEPVDCEGRPTTPHATIGGAAADPGATLDELRQNADFALYHAKETRRGGAVVYSPDLGTTMTRRLGAIHDVGAALREDRIDAHYQPIVRIDTGEVVGLEALFRVRAPDGAMVAAGDYFEATSDVHTATRLTGRMLDIVAGDIRAWTDQGIEPPHVSINAAAADFQGGGLHAAIRAAFARHGAPLDHVVLEVTESVYLGQAGERVARDIQAMRAAGLRVALDDFGTGFASLTHLLSAPIDIIKIDKSFVARMEPDSPSAAIVEGLLSMARKLGLEVVAEGVETEAQARQLRAFGCRLGQGYLYSRAVDRRVVTRLLAEAARARAEAVPEGWADEDRADEDRTAAAPARRPAA